MFVSKTICTTSLMKKEMLKYLMSSALQSGLAVGVWVYVPGAGGVGVAPRT